MRPRKIEERALEDFRTAVSTIVATGEAGRFLRNAFLNDIDRAANELRHARRLARLLKEQP